MVSKWEIGDKIGGLYEIREILGGEGKSGMGTVYICYYPWHQKLYALKTYQDRFAALERLINSFYKEAMLWMRLERHPNIVQAHWVHKLDGRIYIVMEYIPPDNKGRRSLHDHLRGGPLPLIRTLIWSIQFCYGMEYAYSKGIKVHRDIKPDNILITLDKILKITDFGLAKAFGEEPSLWRIIGTPFWMSPEQFEDPESCDVRSDIYSFGIVLYQMATGKLPFNVQFLIGEDFFHQMYRVHKNSIIPKIDSPLFPIIEKCMAKAPQDRYNTFTELRKDLENLWVKITDIPLPKPLSDKAFGYKELNQKGVALKHLGKPEEALKYHDEAIEENPVYPNAWNDKGVALWELDKRAEALNCFDKAIEIDHEFVHPICNKAGVLSELDKYEEAIKYYDEGIKIEPDFINLWRGKADTLLKIGRYEDALHCIEKLLEINRRDSWGWFIKGYLLFKLYGKEKFQEAIKCAKNALTINPFNLGAIELITRIKKEIPKTK